MFIKRLVVSILGLPIAIAVIYLGGWVYYTAIALVLVLAAYEYVQMFRTGGLHPAGFLVPLAVFFVVLGRILDGFESASWLLSLIILAMMAYHLLSYERGCLHAGTDFGVSLGGALYLGWIGAYLISLRDLPDGRLWLLLVLPVVWIADTGAYFAGKWFGRRPLSPRLSPKKTWEGYWGGIACGTLGGVLLGFLLQTAASPGSGINSLSGSLIGFVLATVTTLGDLGESMFKRQAGVKDSGTLLPGHGGVFDRIDSWLWAGVIGYYLIVWLLIN